MLNILHTLQQVCKLMSQRLSEHQWRINTSDSERADIQTVALHGLLSKITLSPLC